MAHRFVLVGGDAALDFINTVHDWTATQRHDYLAGFLDAARFGEAAAVLSRAEARRLTRLPESDELGRLRESRSRLERILRAVVLARIPKASDLDALALEAAAAAQCVRLRGSWRQVIRRVSAEKAGGALLRWRLADAALALLTSDRLSRVKSCPSCGWFFLDTSRNRSRRWCSMTMCGNSAKSRRYYWRKRRRKTT